MTMDSEVFEITGLKMSDYIFMQKCTWVYISNFRIIYIFLYYINF